MPLSKQQEEEMYKNTLIACESINWIRERLDKGDVKLNSHCKRLLALEGDQILLKGKLGIIVVVLSLCFTAALHAIGWFVQVIGK